MIQGIIFDMDGILFDTEALSLEIGDIVAKNMGYTLTREQAVSLCGLNYELFCKNIRNILGSAFEAETYYANLQKGMFERMQSTGIPKKEGVDFLLSYLAQNNYKIALASSTNLKVILQYLEKSQIRQFFDAVVGGDMVHDSKPHPEIFIRAATEIGVAPEQCAAVEDSFNGIISAHSAGCVTIMVPDVVAPTPEIQDKCTAVLPSLTEIPAFLEQYAN